MRPTINSQKHIVQVSLTGIVAGAIRNEGIATAVRAADADAATEVRVGSVVKAVFIEMWYTSDDATQSSLTVCLEKLPDGGDNLTFGESQALDGYFNKSNIFYITQGLIGPKVGTAIPFMRGWFKIPKGKQRMTEKSKLVLNTSAISDGVNLCGFITYKEYY